MNLKKNDTKKWLAAAVAFTVALGAAGCGSGEKSKIRSYDVEKYVTLGSYDGLAVEVAGDFEVSDEDVENYINDMLKYYPNYTDSDKQVVEEGDCVNIDYEGKRTALPLTAARHRGMCWRSARTALFRALRTASLARRSARRGI